MTTQDDYHLAKALPDEVLWDELRRRGYSPLLLSLPNIITVGPMTLETSSGEMTWGSDSYSLTRRQAEIIALLAARWPRWVRRDVIGMTIWSRGNPMDLKSLIRRLRYLLGPDRIESARPLGWGVPGSYRLGIGGTEGE